MRRDLSSTEPVATLIMFSRDANTVSNELMVSSLWSPCRNLAYALRRTAGILVRPSGRTTVLFSRQSFAVSVPILSVIN